METTTINAPFKVGDILHFSWGYNCRINTFIRITKVTAKKAFFEELERRQVENLDGYGQYGTEVPTDEVCGYRLTNGQGTLCGNELKIHFYGKNHLYASLWDGKPQEFYGD